MEVDFLEHSVNIYVELNDTIMLDVSLWRLITQPSVAVLEDQSTPWGHLSFYPFNVSRYTFIFTTFIIYFIRLQML